MFLTLRFDWFNFPISHPDPDPGLLLRFLLRHPSELGRHALPLPGNLRDLDPRLQQYFFAPRNNFSASDGRIRAAPAHANCKHPRVHCRILWSNV